MRTFKNYTWVPPEISNSAMYRHASDVDELSHRGLTIEDVTYEDLGQVAPAEYLTVFTVKRFLWLRRLLRCL